MKAKTIVFVGVMLLVVGAIAYIESTKPDIPIDTSAPVVSSGELPADYAVDASVFAAKQQQFPLAPEIVPTGEWLNSEPQTITGLRGKVVLVDFWTYSCINCIRTLPYIESWHEKYNDSGLVILAVHTPEFEFEKNAENVQRAAEKYGLKYAIVQDNEYRTWRAYSNRYWPRKYLIDIDGFIRYDHIGEGGYEETEEHIQELLKERNARLNMTMDVEKPLTVEQTQNHEIGTPELYFGYGFRRNVDSTSEYSICEGSKPVGSGAFVNIDMQ